MKKYYIAYGSNLNKVQMAYRCPKARPAGTAVIQDYELLFKGSRTGAYLTIEPKAGSLVPVGIWEVTESDEARLDRYEGFPDLYRKEEMEILLKEDGSGTTRPVTAFVYIMDETRRCAEPGWGYWQTCLQGYRDFGLKERSLEQALIRTRKEVWNEREN